MCCPLLSKRKLYVLTSVVGLLAVLMVIVGAGTMATGLQIAVEPSSTPSIPTNPNGTNSTGTSPTPAQIAISSTPSPKLRASNPVPWTPTHTSNLQGAWFAYGCIGLGIYTIIASLAGLYGSVQGSKDLLRLFACSAALDLVMHLSGFLVLLLLPKFRPNGSWTNSEDTFAVVLPIVFIVEMLAVVSAAVLSANVVEAESDTDMYVLLLLLTLYLCACESFCSSFRASRAHSLTLPPIGITFRFPSSVGYVDADFLVNQNPTYDTLYREQSDRQDSRQQHMFRDDFVDRGYDRDGYRQNSRSAGRGGRRERDAYY